MLEVLIKPCITRQLQHAFAPINTHKITKAHLLHLFTSKHIRDIWLFIIVTYEYLRIVYKRDHISISVIIDSVMGPVVYFPVQRPIQYHMQHPKPQPPLDPHGNYRTGNLQQDLELGSPEYLHPRKSGITTELHAWHKSTTLISVVCLRCWECMGFHKCNPRQPLEFAIL